MKSVQEILGSQEAGHPINELSTGGDDLIVFIILVGVLEGMDPRGRHFMADAGQGAEDQVEGLFESLQVFLKDGGVLFKAEESEVDELAPIVEGDFARVHGDELAVAAVLVGELLGLLFLELGEDTEQLGEGEALLDEVVFIDGEHE